MKIISIVLLCILLNPLFGEFLTKKEQNFIKNHKTLKVKINKDWAPYENSKYFNALPFLKNYVEVVAKKIGLSVQFIQNTNEDFDLICAMKKSPKREEKFIFSKDSVFKLYTAMVSPKSSNNIDPKKLNNKTVAVVHGSYIISRLREKFPNIRLIECENSLDALKLVLQKKADVVIGNYRVLNYLSKKYFASGLHAFVIKDYTLSGSVSQYLAFKKKDILLKGIIDKAIFDIKKDEKNLLKSKMLNEIEDDRIELSNTQKRYLKNHVVSIITTTSWLPINTKDKNSNVIGIGLDYWKLIAKKSGIKFKIHKALNFAEVLKDIRQKKYDINIATSQTLDKENYAIFSKTYEKFPIAIATLKSNHFIINGVELEGKRVAVGRNYSTYFLLKEIYPKIRFIYVKDTKEALEMVEQKKVFAAVDIEPVLRYQIIYGNFNDIDITGVTGVDFNLQVMLRDDLSVLRSIIDRSIGMITNEERISIYKKWMGLNRKNVVDYDLISKIVAIFLILLSLFLFAYIREKRLKNKIVKLNMNLQKRVDEAVEKSKKNQVLMLQQSRLAQMGEVISMIAHQWRQPLNSLNILTGTLLMKHRNDSLDENYMVHFEKNSKNIISQMSKTIDDFRNFFKPTNQKKKFCLNNVVSSSIEIIEPILIKHRIDILYDNDEDYYISGYQSEVMQAIINIINNAKDALISKDGRREIKIKLIQHEKMILLSISNNGNPIPPEYIDNIFDPYFSTKEEKNGTGLGLYMTKLIIEEHMNGSIRVDSDIGKTIFLLEFQTP